MISEEFVKDAPRSGHSKKVTEEMEKEILEDIRKSQHGREKSAAELGWKFEVSDISILCTLHKHNLCKCKPSYKPGLMEEMKRVHYEFAMKYKDMDLEFWKNVIWTNETSIVLGHCQEGIQV